MSWIALGIAQGKALQVREAIATLSRAAVMAPGDWRPFRHRGHRYVTSRRFDLAARDLARAAELEQGSFEVWYHLGLARHLMADWAGAREAYARIIDSAPTLSDEYGYTEWERFIPAAYWLYLTFRRAGRKDEAEALLARVPDASPVAGTRHPEMTAYDGALRFARGDVTAEALAAHPGIPFGEQAIVDYAVGSRSLVEGRLDAARARFEKAVARPWQYFGAIAAEAELARLA